MTVIVWKIILADTARESKALLLLRSIGYADVVITLGSKLITVPQYRKLVTFIMYVTFFMKYKRIFTDCSTNSVSKNHGQLCTLMILSVLMKTNFYLNLEWNYLRLVSAYFIYLYINKEFDVPSKSNALATRQMYWKNFSRGDRKDQSL